MNPRLGMQPESRHSTCCRPCLGDQARRLEMIEIPLTQGQVALIDDEDFELVSKYNWCAAWAPTVRGYYASTHNKTSDGGRTTLLLHRVIANPPKGIDVDHINRNTLDNTRANLRLASRAQNAWNSPHNIKNTSGFKGVHWHRQYNGWMARISVNGKRITLGVRSTPEEAFELYKDAAAQLHGEFARLQ